ncbi:SDR family NAD(P)-dependent oxidoreductase [Streptomyces sp. NPDC058632]|uniref:SDR family NAD(P)-dependent oxidoreductase n=1 Tax=unclassified Streptomyces TaxID=2593676 RepID=UPI003668BB4E
MAPKLTGTVALVTGASSGIGAATARRLAGQGASVAVVARRKDRPETPATEITRAGGTALAVEADITDRDQAETSVRQTVERFGRLDILVGNAGLMPLGPVVGADPQEWERVIAVNVRGLLHTTHAALPHLLKAAEEGPRQVADIADISSVAGRRASADFGVYDLTEFGVNGFTESLRQEPADRHVRVGVLEPGAVDTELGSHNNDTVHAETLDPFNEQHERHDEADMAAVDRLTPPNERRTTMEYTRPGSSGLKPHRPTTSGRRRASWSAAPAGTTVRLQCRRGMNSGGTG